MKKLVLLSLSILIGSVIFAQQRYLINLSDKAETEYAVDKPEEFLSGKAIERRNRQGIAIDKSDLPVSKAYLEALENQGVHIISVSKWLNTVIIQGIEPGKADQISSLPFVEKVKALPAPVTDSEKPFFKQESLHPLHKSAQSGASDQFDYGQAHNQIDMINGIPLHEMGFSGQGMVIAVIDAGFQRADEIEVFDSLWVNEQIIATHNFAEPGGDVFDNSISSHGTMVLSTIAAYLPGEMVGTAPKAEFYLLRSEDASAEYIEEEYFWVEAAEYADSAGVDVINSSLGYTTFDDPQDDHSYEDLDGNTTPITIGADMAAQKGILVTNSAGNYANSSWTYIGAPADGDSVFAIGAVDANGNWASFSSIGPTYDGRIKPNVAAQGQGTTVATPYGNIVNGNGTSFSSPIIAGMNTCLWQANPAFNNYQIMEAIMQTASQGDDPDVYLGYGIPDYLAAHEALQSVTVQKHTLDKLFNVRPVPFDSHIELSVNQALDSSVSLKLYNSTGELIKRMDDQLIGRKLRIDGLSQYRSGLYVLTINTELGEVHLKLIKQ
ncbi:MAG: S8 family serine peptidase [Bacteroidales bacterium]|nr:S8 family serine peptidase [Bacteroidales bacterium]